MRVLLNQRVPVEPGITLATDVYRPEGPGAHPVIVMRTPYHRKGQLGIASQFVRRGYAFVAQDCRGKYDSDGVFEPLVYEANDGQKLLDWVANQSWCNGRIGLWGRSYPGIVQVPAASGGHEALRCMAPSVTPGSWFNDWIRYDGCFAHANMIRWLLQHATVRTQPSVDHFEWSSLFQSRTLSDVADRAGINSPTLEKWSRLDRYDEYWEEIDQARMHPHVRVPGYHVGGWFDHLTRGTIRSFQNIGAHGASEAARRGQRLLIGPWGHKTSGHTYGAWDFTPEADISVLVHEMQFFDYHLKEIDNGFSALQPVKVFVVGPNRWERLSAWPPPEASLLSWHLDSNGSANMSTGNGALSLAEPQRQLADTFRYDPADPVPTRGGPIYWGVDHLGPVDQRPILDRPDVLVYRSESLAEPITVMGEIALDLHIASSGEDTDYIVKLCVQEAEGSVISLAIGSLRCRYRESWSEPKPLVPGTATPIRIELGSLAYVFPKGSRILLTITSSDFPRIQTHTNTMEPPWSRVAPVVVQNSVIHGPGTGTALHLPVVTR